MSGASSLRSACPFHCWTISLLGGLLCSLQWSRRRLVAGSIPFLCRPPGSTVLPPLSFTAWITLSLSACPGTGQRVDTIPDPASCRLSGTGHGQADEPAGTAAAWGTSELLNPHEQELVPGERAKLTPSASAHPRLPCTVASSLCAHEQVASFLPSHDSHQLPCVSGSR